MSRKIFLGALGALTALSLLLAGAVAQAQVRQTLKVEVPFAFVVDNTTLPAGHYTLSAVDPMTKDAMKIRNDKTDVGVVFLVNPAADSKLTADKPQLVFDEYGNERYLSELMMPHRGTALEVVASPAGERMERKGTPTRRTIDGTDGSTGDTTS